MPFGIEGVEPGIGLALSGGGFRATLFHCGALCRLGELGILGRAESRASPAAPITAGVLATQWTALRFEGNVPVNLRELVVAPLQAFCHRTIDAPAIGLGALLPGRRPSDLLQAAYAEHLYGTVTLHELPDRPRFVFNATNLATGVSFRFSKPYAGDYRIGLIPDPTFPVALAVTASSAFPPFLSPVVIEMDPGGEFQRVEGADLFDQVAYRERLLLTGRRVRQPRARDRLEPLRTVLTSDAGAPFGLELDPETAWHSQVLRALDIATNPSARAPETHPDPTTTRAALGRARLGYRHRHPEVRARRFPAGASEPHPGARRDADPVERLLRCGAGTAHQLGICRVRRRDAATRDGRRWPRARVAGARAPAGPVGSHMNRRTIG